MEEQKLQRKKRRAHSEGNLTLLATICIDLGEYYMRTGHYTSAIEEFVVVADVYQQLDKKLDYGSANRMIGEAYMQIREFDKALKYQQIHLDVAVKEKNELEEQRALANMGHIYLTKYLDMPNNPDKNILSLACDSFKKSLKVCERLSYIDKKEHLDMTARLLANLGVVEECLKRYEKGISLVQRSIKICKDNDLFEHLERSYKILGSLYLRNKEYGSAVDSYNLAINTADRLPNKTDLKCESLVGIADVYIDMSDLRSAKNKLRKAHNLKHSNDVERENIMRSLKTVAAMCYAEDSLETTPANDHKKRKNIFEKLGDGACLLKHYAKGVEYYKKMLDEAELSGETGNELIPCYISLAQTYKDMGEYKMALQYFQKEYDLNKGNVEESVATLFNIADLMNAAGDTIENITNTYLQIRNKCQMNGAVHLEGKTVKRHADFFRSKNKIKEAIKLERELIDLHYVSSDEDDSEEEANTPNIGEELDIEDITDVSDDGERAAPQRSVRARGMMRKRNLKGETQLHTACIKGDVDAVKKLLEQGHPVNVRDYCGWLPIHEACICGHLEIVKMLVEHKADFNDRGGKDCLGVTPLHDACTNGHLEIIRYLLDRGASVLAKTDDGQTPLHFLQQWRQTAVSQTDEELHLYNSIVKRMNSYLERYGQKVDRVSVASSNAYVNDGDEVGSGKKRERRRSHVSSTPSPSPRKKTQRSPKGIEEARRRICDTESEEEVSARNQYKEAMENLRRRSVSTQEKKRKSDEIIKTAHVENIDDWLEDDLGIGSVAKKRKSSNTAIHNFLYTSNTRKLPSDSEVESRIETTSDDSEDGFTMKSKSKRKTQISLIKAGFSRSKTSPPKTSPMKFVKKTAEADSSVSEVVAIKQMQMFSIDVRIEEKLYRVPIPASELNTCTIKWLAEEASKRYFKREGMKPSLELETKNGAILAEEDLLSMLFPIGSTQAEELKATILKRSLPPLTERYEEACIQMKSSSNDELKNVLKQTSTVLDLSDLVLRGSVLMPLCKALNRQDNLIELNFSGNFMKDDCFQLLCSSLPTLTHLATLNLNLNHLTASSMKYFSDMFTNNDKPVLEHLVSLNLSYNPINDDGFRYLALITKYLRLKDLDLSNVNFTAQIFENFHTKNLELYLGNVESLKINHNALNKSGILKFISWLNPNVIQELDVSNNCVTEQSLVREMIKSFKRSDDVFLKKIGLANCLVDDYEVFDLLRILSSCSVNLSNNKNLSSISLRRLLLHQPPLTHLDMYGCNSLCKYFDATAINTWRLPPADSINSFTISVYDEGDGKCLEALKRMWQERHKDKAGHLVEMGVIKFFVFK